MHVDLHEHGFDQVATVKNPDEAVLLVIPNHSLCHFYA